MTSFVESPRFPEDIRFGVSGGAEYNTTIITTGSGEEQRNRNWSDSRGRYTLDHGPHNLTRTESLISFFRIVGGMEKGFRFKDWTDYSVDQASTGKTALVTSTTYQLQKAYILGSYTELRTVTKPVTSSVKVYKDNVLQTLTTDYTLDSTTGIVTFLSSPGVSVITWTGEFDVPVRFNSDRLEITTVDKGLYSWQQIELIEVRR